jgi:hypothetical protein
MNALAHTCMKQCPPCQETFMDAEVPAAAFWGLLVAPQLAVCISLTFIVPNSSAEHGLRFDPSFSKRDNGRIWCRTCAGIS